MNKEIKIIDSYKIYEHLHHIRLRPTLFLISKSIIDLENYLRGYYLYARKDYSEDIYNDGDPDFIEFRWWLVGEPKINMSNGPSYYLHLLEQCNNDEEKAFDLFFEKLDEFKELKRKANNV